VKFVYVLDPDIAKDFENKGLLVVKTVKIGEREAVIFENKRDVQLETYEKFSDVFWSNKLMF
jgi:hypothetical protein